MAGPMTTVTIVRGAPTPAQALRLYHELFPEHGTYTLAKAQAAREDTDPFETWFLRKLEEQTRAGYLAARDAIWQTLDALLARNGVTAPSHLDGDELAQTLTDLSRGATSRMVGIRPRPDVAERLRALGWNPTEVLDFPALAYRMGLLWERLQGVEPVAWSALHELVRDAFPLSTAEHAAVTLARNRAGIFLRPIFDATGQVWAVEHEIGPLRAWTERALRERTHPLRAASELGKQQRADGLIRDAERVMRTEIAHARSHGAWDTMIRQQQDRLAVWVYRRPSPRACAVCLALYTTDGRTPRLYRLAAVEASDAGVCNRGPTDTWVAKIGPTHPNCMCGPWLPAEALPGWKAAA